MHSFAAFFKGYLKIRVWGKQVERFLNLCRHHKIFLHKMNYTEEQQIECLISLSDFFSIQPIRRKTHVKIKILKKRGLPFFFHQHKKRKAFFIGCCVCLVVIWLLSERIWIISVEGNVVNTTPEIIKFLEKEGINHGTKRSKIDCGELADLMRENYEDMTWVSAKLSGSKLTVCVKEGVLLEEVYGKKSACDLQADKTGTIVKMVTRSGVPQKKIGDICEAGDILFLGRIDILNDEQEVVRYDYVHADADVYIQYEIPYYRKFALEENTEQATGKSKKSLALQFGPLYIDFSIKPKEGIWREIREIQKIRITESFYIPVSFTKIMFAEYEKTSQTLSEKEAKQRAYTELECYEKNLIQKGVQIFVNNVKIEINHEFCVSCGTLEVIEKIGKEIPQTTLEQPNRKDIIE